MSILVLNAGSSSLKCALFDGPRCRVRGQVDGIGVQPRLRIGGEARDLDVDTTHPEALRQLLDRLDGGVTAVGHRVVHGGTEFTAPTRLDDGVLARLAGLNPLAPLHNPVSLEVITAARQALPDAPQVACFDTAFHAGQPAIAARFAIPDDARTEGLRRYGFHGLSYAGLVTAIEPLPERLLACHLGNGASLCAILNGRGIATTMGYSPLDGLAMGTRSGSIDPAAVLELARRIGIDAAETLLTRESGLLGLSGTSSDMRALAASGRPADQAAIAHFVYWLVRHAGSMIAALGGLDGIAFTGGIGENAADVRAEACAQLSWTGLRIVEGAMPDTAGRMDIPGSTVAAFVVAADEEAVIAREVERLV